MSTHCASCDRTLDFDDESLRFCPYCGTSLNPSTPPTDTPRPHSETADYHPVPDESGSDDEEPIPQSIGGYRIVRLIGTGGMGSVYEAEAPNTGHRVALKLLSKRYTTNPVSLERFRQEGRLASQISHPRCVFVYAADSDRGRPYIVMELMAGSSLKDLVEQRGPLPPQEAITLILDVIEGLREAHRHGVIHRDVKPSNCFLMPDGRVKIGDFGLSKSLTSKANLTQSGAFLGTVLYASPEQIRGKDVEYASDVYSICATLFYLLTGRAPFEHESITAALALIISEDAPDVRSVRPEVPRSLAKVVNKGLHRDQSRRWQNLDELKNALVALVPNQLSFGGLWVRVGAYLLDWMIIWLCVVRPLTVVFSPKGSDSILSPVLLLTIFPLYYVITEGLAGASIGKWLFRLRVCRVGSADPPGLGRAALRTLVFFLLIVVTLAQPGVLVERLFTEGFSLNFLASAVPFVLGLTAIIWPMRHSNDYRGLHEWISGTCVMQLPRPQPQSRFLPHGPKRLEALLPPALEIPEQVGPYVIRAAGPPMTNGDRLLLAEDPVLGRRVLVWLRPAHRPAVEPARIEVNRPSRLRSLGRGSVKIAAEEYIWQAFMAPTGAPLEDVIHPDRPLRWSLARPILDQLVQEITLAEADGTLPESLDISQVWVEPNGHLQLLDCPIPPPGNTHTKPVTSRTAERGTRRPNSPSGGSPEASPRVEGAAVLARGGHPGNALDLIGQTATLLLEGRPRTPGQEETQTIHAPLPRHVEELLRPVGRGSRRYHTPHNLQHALNRTRQNADEVTTTMRLGQLSVECVLLGLGLFLMFGISGGFTVFHGTTRDYLFETIHHLLPVLTPSVDWNSTEIASLILIWPLLWAGGAYLFRGGLSFSLFGIRIVERDGSRASRRRCAVRALLIWLPIALLLCGAVMIQKQSTSLVPVAGLLWWFALIAALTYCAIALIFPNRPAQDRLLRTYLVPR